MEPVLLEKKESIGYVILNRPEQRNALSIEVMNAICQIIQSIEKDRDIRVVIIKGNGKMFCAGHDIKEMTAARSDIHKLREIFGICSDMMLSIHRLPQPVIAQVHGIATAAGCQLVAACDMAVAESGAKFSTPGVKIGLFCSTPMVPLARVIGRRRALEMLLTGRYISAQEAEKFGLVNLVTTPEALEEETFRLAKDLAQNSLFTLSFGKQAFYRQIDLDEAAAYNYAKEIITINSLAEDAREGMSAFIEKRKPVWKDR